ncbi:hypothetical protein V5O48_014595 [Marasmius crinis-equi]|uniref:Argonaute-like protein n=1 Tax=Marasmius crinis-equi TaxID=585013 RepID=A0ABR3EWV3_9AGAR
MPPRPARGGPRQPQPQPQSQPQPPTQPPPPHPGRGGPGGAWGGRGAGRGRGGPPQPGRGGQPPGAGGQRPPQPTTTTVGVRKPPSGPGRAGRPVDVFVNATEMSIPEEMIYHYDVAITGPSGKSDSFPTRFTQELMKQLQFDTAPTVFTPAGVYDGKKNLYIAHLLNLSGGDYQTFTVPVSSSAPSASGQPRPPALYSIKIAKANEINPEVLRRFVQGQQSQDENVLTALMTMNVAIRQEPINRGFPFNTRSFFPNGPGMMSRPVMGIQFVRGYFQSIRPTIGKVILNVDITTGMFYEAGSLISLCLKYLQPPRNSTDPRLLAPSNGFPDRERIKLERFISGIRVRVTSGTRSSGKIISVSRLTRVGASEIIFNQRDGTSTNVAEYFRRAHNRRLQYPDVICAQASSSTTSGSAMPLELLEVLPGQIARKQVPPDVTAAMVEFSQLKPHERMAEIQRGVQLLAHGQSEYVRSFGMTPSPIFPMSINARVIDPPRLLYGGKGGRKTETVNPRNGSWNLMDKTLIQPQTINRWCLVIFEAQNRFPRRDAENMATFMRDQFITAGLSVLEAEPVIHYGNAQRDISGELRAAGVQCVQKNGGRGGPDLVIAILPDVGNTDIYRGVKHFGDVEMGVATQCLKASKCKRAKPQYWANVALKVNPKLGGVNHRPDPSSRQSAELNDPNKPTIIMGADVAHPAPGSTLPSYTAVVGNVDSDVAKYVAEIRCQTSRVEIIEDLGEMVRNILTKYMDYRQKMEKKANFKPARLLFFRDGVDEGQYQRVKDRELQIIRDTCESLKINPAITFVIVAKRHHFRFFPKDPNDTRQADPKSQNCLAGTVIDTGITHPIEFDFYLQSHGGLLGTSRSAHYHVLSDDNHFTADALQGLCYGLCHVFARSTRTISIPAPVAYADLVCARAPNHYKSSSAMSDIESTTTGGRDRTLDRMRADFKPIHQNQERRTFFT